MLRKFMNVKAHAATGAPLAAFTATISEEELQTVQKAAGRKKPMDSVGPIRSGIPDLVRKMSGFWL